MTAPCKSEETHHVTSITYKHTTLEAVVDMFSKHSRQKYESRLRLAVVELLTHSVLKNGGNEAVYSEDITRPRIVNSQYSMS